MVGNNEGVLDIKKEMGEKFAMYRRNIIFYVNVCPCGSEITCCKNSIAVV